MAPPNQCDGCSEADTCKEVYRRLGGTEGPSVALTVLVAFLLPIVVFVISLAAFGWLLEDRVAGPYQTPLALVLALSVTTGSMLALRVAVRRHQKR